MITAIGNSNNNPVACDIQVRTAQSANSVQNFGQVLSNAMAVEKPRTTEAVVSDLESLGVRVTVRAVPNNSEATISHAQTVGGGFNSVTIAPNIIQQMADDDGVRQKYTDKILWWQNTYLPSILSTTPIHGGRFTSMTKTIHEDGTVTYVLFGQAPHEIDGEYDNDRDGVSDRISADRTVDTAEVYLAYEPIPVIGDSHLAESKIASLVLSEPIIRTYLNRSSLVGANRIQIEPVDAAGMFSNMASYSDNVAASQMVNMLLADSVMKQYSLSFR